jgi:hypothetical protein
MEALQTAIELKSFGSVVHGKDLLMRLDEMIANKENFFCHALIESMDSHVLFHLKNDLDFLKEKRAELAQQSS